MGAPLWASNDLTWLCLLFVCMATHSVTKGLVCIANGSFLGRSSCKSPHSIHFCSMSETSLAGNLSKNKKKKKKQQQKKKTPETKLSLSYCILKMNNLVVCYSCLVWSWAHLLHACLSYPMKHFVLMQKSLAKTEVGRGHGKNSKVPCSQRSDPCMTSAHHFQE